jgi:sporulation protein YlmC with PRC-barrel domain
MSRFLILLSVFGLLLLTSCRSALEIRNSTGKAVGRIEIQGSTATVFNVHGDALGKVRGTIIRDASGKHAGTVVKGDDHIVIQDAADNAVGSIENGTDCYGKGQEKLGGVNGEVDASVAAAACLLFFLR